MRLLLALALLHLLPGAAAQMCSGTTWVGGGSPYYDCNSGGTTIYAARYAQNKQSSGGVDITFAGGLFATSVGLLVVSCQQGFIQAGLTLKLQNSSTVTTSCARDGCTNPATCLGTAAYWYTCNVTASPSLLFVTGMSVTLGDNPLSNSDWKVVDAARLDNTTTATASGFLTVTQTVSVPTSAAPSLGALTALFPGAQQVNVTGETLSVPVQVTATAAIDATTATATASFVSSRTGQVVNVVVGCNSGFLEAFRSELVARANISDEVLANVTCSSNGGSGSGGAGVDMLPTGRELLQATTTAATTAASATSSTTNGMCPAPGSSNSSSLQLVTVSREVALTAAGTTALASVCGSSSLTITSALGGAGSSVACQVVTLAAAGGAELPPVQGGTTQASPDSGPAAAPAGANKAGVPMAIIIAAAAVGAMVSAAACAVAAVVVVRRRKRKREEREPGVSVKHLGQTPTAAAQRPSSAPPASGNEDFWAGRSLAAPIEEEDWEEERARLSAPAYDAAAVAATGAPAAALAAGGGNMARASAAGIDDAPEGALALQRPPALRRPSRDGDFEAMARHGTASGDGAGPAPPAAGSPGAADQHSGDANPPRHASGAGGSAGAVAYRFLAGSRKVRPDRAPEDSGTPGSPSAASSRSSLTGIGPRPVSGSSSAAMAGAGFAGTAVNVIGPSNYKPPSQIRLVGDAGNSNSLPVPVIGAGRFSDGPRSPAMGSSPLGSPGPGLVMGQRRSMPQTLVEATSVGIVSASALADLRQEEGRPEHSRNNSSGVGWSSIRREAGGGVAAAVLGGSVSDYGAHSNRSAPLLHVGGVNPYAISRSVLVSPGAGRRSSDCVYLPSSGAASLAAGAAERGSPRAGPSPTGSSRAQRDAAAEASPGVVVRSGAGALMSPVRRSTLHASSGMGGVGGGRAAASASGMVLSPAGAHGAVGDWDEEPPLEKLTPLQQVAMKSSADLAAPRERAVVGVSTLLAKSASGAVSGAAARAPSGTSLPLARAGTDVAAVMAAERAAPLKTATLVGGRRNLLAAGAAPYVRQVTSPTGAASSPGVSMSGQAEPALSSPSGAHQGPSAPEGAVRAYYGEGISYGPIGGAAPQSPGRSGAGTISPVAGRMPNRRMSEAQAAALPGLGTHRPPLHAASDAGLVYHHSPLQPPPQQLLHARRSVDAAAPLMMQQQQQQSPPRAQPPGQAPRPR
eukprot:XP_001699608.1 predicted protein [Chlamydomonas reinhardtii]